jgi:hypothetical protein
VSSRGPLGRWLAPACAGALLLHALWSTSFREDVGVAFRAQTFAERRVEQAFVGTDMDAVQAALSALIGPDAPITLAPSIETQELFRQRFREALYPRPVRADSQHVLVPFRRGTLSGRRRVGTLGEYDLGLTGPLTEMGTEPVAPPARAAPTVTAGLLTLAVLSVLGLGLAMTRVLRTDPGADVTRSPAAAGLGGLVVVALGASLATWSGLSLPPPVLPLLGLLLLAVEWRRLRPGRPSPWALVPAAALGLLAARLIAAPIARWDGRSIWLFHARRLWERGALLVSEAADPDTLFSHPDYPLAWPAALAFPAGLFGAFDERLAGVGAALAVAFAAALTFTLAREALGAPAAGGLVATLVVHLTRATAGGYAEGLLVFALLSAYLALRSGRLAIAGLALTLAALTKVEGLPLGLLVWVAGTLAAPAPRATRGRLLVAFAPALAHVLWARANGLDSLLKGGAGHTLAVLASRWREALARTPSLLDAPGDTGVRAILGPALLATLVLGIALARGGRRREAAAVLGVVLGSVLLGTGSIAVLPETVDWFVATALDRLLLHGAAFALLGALLVLSDAPAGSAASGPPPPSAGAGSRPAPAS